ncbi:MAG: amidohydrolase [Proteobacteria bacterium]|nr:amidohydrolase [Pseudomonadota bacterium]MDA0992647.1 amidohydrolase [Pseudomonadota bacterium]
MTSRLPGTPALPALIALVCSAAATAATDLIVINGDIYTVDPALPRAQAFAVEDGKFIAVGSNAEIRALTDDNTTVIDAGGNTVTPGFIDGHSHVSGDSPVVAGVDISYIADKDEWLRLIEEADMRLADGEWMTGGYWDHTLSDGDYPTREMLDEVVPDRPIFLNHIDGHYSWVNSLALEMAGVTAETPVPPGGEIMIDKRTGEPTGILLEGAQGLVGSIIPDRSDQQRHEGLATMEKYANSFGITGLHQMGDLDDYLHIVENADPTLRVWFGYRGPRGTGSDYDAGVNDILATKRDIAARVEATGKEKQVGPLLDVGYVKLMNDGVLSAQTAVLMEGYTDREGWKGEYITGPDDLKMQVEKLTAAGLPVAIHSIGDAAVRASLDAFEAAKNNAVPFRNRIEHIELVHPDDVRRFRDLDVVASMQPNHATNAIGYVPVRVGAYRESRAYVWKSMLTAGVPLVFGADYPTSPLNPLVQMADAMFRESPFGFNSGKPWHPEQAVSFEEALHAYTQAGADVTQWKDQLGSITPGKWADFVVLDGSVPVPMNDSFRKLSVDSTYFAGREVYGRPQR